MKKLACCLLYSIAFLPSCLAEFDWTTDLKSALKEAQEQQKPVIAYFYYRLSYIREMEVWASPLLKKYESEFIPVKMEVDESTEAIKQYNLVTFPSVLFFDPQGREILACRFEEDKLERSQIYLRIKKTLTKIEEFTLLESQKDLLQTNPKMMLQYAKGLCDRALFHEAEEEYIRLFSRADMDAAVRKEAEEAYAQMALFHASRSFYQGDYSACIERLQRYLAKAKPNEYTSQVNYLLGVAMIETGSRSEGERILKDLIRQDTSGLFAEKAKNYLERKKG